MQILFNNTQNPKEQNDNPLGILFSCHEKVARFCQQLLLLPDYLREKGSNDMVKRDVAQIIRYFTQAAPLHHLDESEDLFPALLAAAPEHQADIVYLLGQHEQFDGYWQELQQKLEVLDRETDWAVLFAFVKGYQEHMVIEEKLFQAALVTLPKTTLLGLQDKMTARRTQALGL